MPRSPDELRRLAEDYLAELAFTPELGGLEEALRYPLDRAASASGRSSALR